MFKANMLLPAFFQLTVVHHFLMAYISSIYHDSNWWFQFKEISSPLPIIQWKHLMLGDKYDYQFCFYV